MTENLDLEAYEALAEEGLRTGYATRADEAIRDLVAEVRRLRDALDRQGARAALTAALNTMKEMNQ